METVFFQFLCNAVFHAQQQKENMNFINETLQTLPPSLTSYRKGHKNRTIFKSL